MHQLALPQAPRPARHTHTHSARAAHAQSARTHARQPCARTHARTHARTRARAGCLRCWRRSTSPLRPWRRCGATPCAAWWARQRTAATACTCTGATRAPRARASSR
jgi:hypothetical protein